MIPIAEESKARVIKVYDDAAPTYNLIGPSFFKHFGQRLAGSAGISPGAQVLDIATGTGAALLPAAELVGINGDVVGVDVSSRMIARARAEILDKGLATARVLVADAERLPFLTSSFDCVLCSFAIFLFPTLSRFVSECHRVLRSPGRIGLVYSAGEDEEWTWYEQLISKYRPMANLGTERYKPQDVEAALDNAGFRIASTSVEVHRLIFSNPSEFWGWAWSHGDRAVLESLAGSSSAFERELFEEFSSRTGKNGLTYRVFAAITLASRQ
jgi:ubiquinone/menaquinone biosynthesis C-methylase UbiE